MPQDSFNHRVRWAARVLWRGKYILLVCLLAFVIPTVFILQQIQPLYTAEAQVMVEAPIVSNALSMNQSALAAGLSENVIQTEAELIQSTLLARRIVDKLHLDEDPEFNAELRPKQFFDSFLESVNPTGWEQEGKAIVTEAPTVDAADSDLLAQIEMANVVRQFGRQLLVFPRKRSYLISIRYTSVSREKAMLIANTTADTYVVDRLEASFEESRRVSSWLADRLEGLRREVNIAENAAEEFRARNGLRSKNEREATLTDQQMSELNSRLVIARADLAQKQAQLDQLQRLRRSPESLETASDVLQSGLIQSLRQQEATVRRAMSEAQKTYDERHPRLVGLKAELAEIRMSIASEVEKVAAALFNDVEVARAQVRAEEQALASVKVQVNLEGQAEVKLRELERQAEATRTLYENFLNRFKTEAGQERMQRANARVVSRAELPIKPSYPLKPQIIIAVSILALILGVALLFLLDRLNNVVRSSDEAEDLTGLPVLGLIPLRRNSNGRPFEDILQSPRSDLADAVRGLRTAIDLDKDSGGPIIMITSSRPREGKSFVSMCLAVMFSRSEQRVLLIDADLHRPSQHTMSGTSGERGLAQILGGEATFDEVVHRGAINALDFLPAGKVADVSELLLRPSLGELLRDLAGRYDRIIVDTSPVLAVSDARVLAGFANRVIYLIGWNETPREAIRNGVKLLRGVGSGIFGVVLSRVNWRKHSRYGYRDYGHYYGQYREYYSE